MNFKTFLNLIRVLFPNWNFFDQIGHSLAIEYRSSNTDFWQTLELSASRGFTGLFFNPEVNLALAQGNIIEHFARDAQEQPENIENLSSYKMLRSMLKLNSPSVDKIQFKLTARKDNEFQILYTSNWLQL